MFQMLFFSFLCLVIIIVIDTNVSPQSSCKAVHRFGYLSSSHKALIIKSVFITHSFIHRFPLQPLSMHFSCCTSLPPPVHQRALPPALPPRWHTQPSRPMRAATEVPPNKDGGVQPRATSPPASSFPGFGKVEEEEKTQHGEKV